MPNEPGVPMPRTGRPFSDDDAGRHRALALLARAMKFGLARVEVGPVQEVVQHEAGVAGHEAAAERCPEALGDRDDVALAVRDLEVGGVVAGVAAGRPAATSPFLLAR